MASSTGIILFDNLYKKNVISLSRRSILLVIQKATDESTPLEWIDGLFYEFTMRNVLNKENMRIFSNS